MTKKKTLVISLRKVLKHFTVIFALSAMTLLAQSTTELETYGNPYRQRGIYMYGFLDKNYIPQDRFKSYKDVRKSYYVSSCFMGKTQHIGRYAYYEISEIQNKTTNKLILYSIGLFLDFEVVIVGYIIFFLITLIGKRINIRIEK